jgi:hypothetical protein
LCCNRNTVSSLCSATHRLLSRGAGKQYQERAESKVGGTMIWAAGVLGLLLVAGGAYREYFAENEETEGEGSILTNALFIAGVLFLTCAGLYGMYRMLS